MELSLILLIVCVAAVAGVIGFQIAALMYQAIFADMLEKLGVTEEQVRKLGKQLGEELGQDTSVFDEVDGKDAINIRIEKHNNTLYAYRKDTEEFLGQGTDKDELIERLNSKFANGAHLIVTEDDGAALVKE
jgi:hypothetical protein